MESSHGLYHGATVDSVTMYTATFWLPPFVQFPKKIFFLDSTQNYKTIGENFIKIRFLEAELLHFENCTFIWKYENDVTIYKMKFSLVGRSLCDFVCLFVNLGILGI